MSSSLASLRSSELARSAGASLKLKAPSARQHIARSKLLGSDGRGKALRLRRFTGGQL